MSPRTCGIAGVLAVPVASGLAWRVVGSHKPAAGSAASAPASAAAAALAASALAIDLASGDVVRASRAELSSTLGVSGGLAVMLGAG